ncbi:hypothetical protein ACIQXD_28130 [Streptomyces uncialis]|uniref:hypothetical protein n=1 Tax=Streptomyces uncialis TaxID=1048205 RepID=UPI0038090644
MSCARGDLAEVRSRIRELFDIGPFAQYGCVEYADARAYADQAGQAVTAIRSLTTSGRAADATALTREAIGFLTAVVENVDDSDGCLGRIGGDPAEAHHGPSHTCAESAPAAWARCSWASPRSWHGPPTWLP